MSLYDHSTYGQSLYEKLYLSVIIIIIAPELLPFIAFNDYYRARVLRKLCRENVGHELSMKQAHYLLAGGLQISAPSEHHNNAFEIEFLVFVDQVGLAPSYSCKRHRRFHEFWNTVIASLPSDNALDDKSKSDVVGKALTCIQAGKSLVLIFGRLVCGLEVSLLEVTTAAYIILALISYAFWFKKPYNIATYQTLELPFCSDELHLDIGKYNLSKLSSRATEHLERRGEREVNPRNLVSGSLYSGSMSEEDVYCVPDQGESRRSNVISSAVLIVLCYILAGVHISAWGYQYPSIAEAWLWRTYCLLIGLLPLCLIYAQYVEQWVKNAPPSPAAQWHQKISSTCLYTLYTTYPLARLFLMIEVFTSLRSANPEIYQQPDWTPYLGHIGA